MEKTKPYKNEQNDVTFGQCLTKILKSKQNATFAKIDWPRFIHDHQSLTTINELKKIEMSANNSNKLSFQDTQFLSIFSCVSLIKTSTSLGRQTSSDFENILTQMLFTKMQNCAKLCQSWRKWSFFRHLVANKYGLVLKVISLSFFQAVSTINEHLVFFISPRF